MSGNASHAVVLTHQGKGCQAFGQGSIDRCDSQECAGERAYVLHIRAGKQIPFFGFDDDHQGFLLGGKILLRLALTSEPGIFGHLASEDVLRRQGLNM